MTPADEIRDALATPEQLARFQLDCRIPYLPTQLTYQLRWAVHGNGPRAYDWEDKPHRLVFDACSEIERLTVELAAEKARADKAEAEVARLREAAVKLDNAVAEYLDAEHLWQSDQCAVGAVNAAEAAMKSALYEARKTRAALEANDAGR